MAEPVGGKARLEDWHQILWSYDKQTEINKLELML